MSNILTKGAALAYQEVYSNKHGCRDDFVKFWVESVKRWKDKKGILGYELVNEPFAGDFYADPLLLLPGEAGRKNLSPLYDIVAEEIRKIDDKHIIFYGVVSIFLCIFYKLHSEPVTWGMVLNGKVVGSGLDRVPGGPKWANASAYS